mgnify:FL=1
MVRGDVYDARLNPTEGSEQGGARPVIVVSRDAINRNSPVVVVIPLTDATNVKRLYPNNVHVAAGEGGLSMASVALAGQVRAVAVSHLLRRRGSLSADTMRAIDRALRITLDL